MNLLNLDCSQPASDRAMSNGDERGSSFLLGIYMTKLARIGLGAASVPEWGRCHQRIQSALPGFGFNSSNNCFSDWTLRLLLNMNTEL